MRKGFSIFPGNRKGQFFLIAAVVIISVLISVVTVSNFTSKKEVSKFYDLGEELEIESQQVLDYGTYSELNEDQMKILMEHFVQRYAEYIEEDKNIYFVFGNKNRVSVVGYQEVAEEDVCIILNPAEPECGNRIVEEGEECDDGNTNILDGCSECQLMPASSCENNNQIETGEVCDGTDLNSKTCESLGFKNGTLLCLNCEWDTSNCEVDESAECTPYSSVGQTQDYSTSEEINKVSIEIAGITYQFDLQAGENFYFVIWREIGGEKYVVTSDE